MIKIQSTVLALFAVVMLFTASCTKTNTDTSSTAQYIGTWHGTTSCGEGLGGWAAKAPIFANGRTGCTSFTVNNVVYVAGGSHNVDFWGYNITTNSWSRLADLPGILPGLNRYRKEATGFAVGNYGYIACGADSGFYKNEVWQYDPSTNTWAAMAAFPGAPRIKAFSFVVNGLAYVGGGVDVAGTNLKDMWAYNVATNTWAAMQNVPRTIVRPFAFSIGNNNGYVSCGVQNGTEDTVTFSYDVTANTWDTVAGYPGHPRMEGAAFTINNLAYCGLGNYMGTVAFEDFYSYNSTTNIWSKVGDFTGRFNAEPMCGSYNNKGYVGLGGDVGTSVYTYWYEFTPQSNSAEFTITAGSNNFSINLNSTVGKDTCQQPVTLTGTVSTTTSGKESFSIGTHNVVDKCGQNYAITGSGSLNATGDVITITTVSSSASGTSACTFTGSR